MMKKINIPAVALAATFAFAGRVLSVGKGSLPEFGVAALIALLIIPLAEISARGIFCSKKPSVLGVIFALVVIIAALCTAVTTASEFSSFAAHTMLSGVSELLIKAVFLLLCAYIASFGEGAVRKLSVITFTVAATVSVILFAFSARSFDMSETKDLLGGISASGVIRELGNVFAPAVLALIYLSGDAEKTRLGSRGAVLSVIFASLLLLVCRLNVSLLFGDSFAAALDYPYSEAVSTVTVGRLFARMEGWAYLMYYAASVLRATVCLSLCTRFLCYLPCLAKKKRAAAFALALICLV